MLHFFRKIRHDLIANSKSYKYFKYAIGEIALVVIGILIALQINNWNEEGARKQELKIYMDNLVHDLNNDITTLGIYRNINFYRYNSMQHLLVLSGQKPMSTGYTLNMPKVDTYFSPWEKPFPENYDHEFVKKVFVWTSIAGEMAVNSSTMVELRNNGLYSYIADVDLKNAIDGYYHEYERRLGRYENGNSRKFQDDWRDSLSEVGFNNEDILDSRAALDWLMNNPKATARLKTIILNAKWRFESSDYLKTSAQDLIDLINSKSSN